MWFLMLSHTHTPHLFNNPPPPPPKKIKNRYTKKQPTNFFITPFKTKIKKKKKLKTDQSPNSAWPKNWRLNLKQKWKPHTHNTPVLTIFNFKKYHRNK